MQKLIEEMKMPLPIVLAGNSQRDIEYQEKVLDRLLADTGGHKIAAMSEPDMERFSLMYLIRWGHKNLNFVYAGGYRGSWHQYGSPDFVLRYAPLAAEVLGKNQDKGLLVKSGADAMMGPIGQFGGGGTFSLEQFTAYDITNKESVKGVLAYIEDSAASAREHGFPPGFDARWAVARMTREQRQAHYKALAREKPALHWQWKIAKILDPNDTGDDETYQRGKPTEK